MSSSTRSPSAAAVLPYLVLSCLLCAHLSFPARAAAQQDAGTPAAPGAGQAALTDVRFVGNERMSRRALRKVVRLAKGSMPDGYSLAADERAIAQRYNEKGYPLTTVRSAVGTPAEGQTVLTFYVSEGPRCFVEDVEFLGGRALPRKKLLSVLGSKRRRRPAFLFPGYLDEEVFRDDIWRIYQFYHESGYLDADVSGDITYSEDYRRAKLRFVIYEGPLYIVRRVSFEGNTVFREDELRGEIPLKEGERYSPDRLEEAKRRIRTMYGRQGFVDAADAMKATLRERVTYPAEGQTDVKFEITEGDRVFVRRIRIEGLTKTKDEVVRRNLTFYPGERADTEQMQESKQKLVNTGYFDRTEREPVQIEVAPEQGDLRDVVVRVKEGPTGSFSLSGGVSSVTGLFGQFGFQETNFDIGNWPSGWRDVFGGNALRGGGQTFGFSISAGTERTDMSVSFYEPSVRHGDYSFGTRLFTGVTFWDEFDLEETGLELRVGRKIAKDSRGQITVGFKAMEMADVSQDASFEIARDEGDYDKLYLELEHRIDKLDNPFVPSRGYTTSVSLELAGGDIETWKLLTNVTRYWTVADIEDWGKHIFSLNGRAGVMKSYGGRIPVFERFYAGGLYTIRGFDLRGVAPADPVTGDKIGGESMLIGSAEYSIPVVGDQLRLAAFLDAGYVEEQASDIFSGWGVLRAAAGFGLRWRIPALGQVAITMDLGFPIREEDTDDKRRFHFSLGGIRTF